MILEFCTPAGPLGRYVELITFYEGYAPGHRIEKILPEGVVEVIIDLTEIEKYIYDNVRLEKIQSCKFAWISGLRRECITISALPESSMLVIRFRPGMAFPLLGIPVNELAGLVIDAELIWKDIGLLREALLEAVFVYQRFEIVQGFLLEKLARAASIPLAFQQIIHAMSEAPSEIQLANCIDQSGYSHKHFITLFKKYAGLPPKQFVRVMKFQEAIHAIEARKEIYWPDVAYACGYYDQAHFIQDFKAFSGMTPTEYLHAKGDTINYIPVA